ncbi:DNA-directed RNA polymerases I and III subunit RPAC2 [Prorops nasuta]|uniref:DNA-directed RNA polymerases I and III subunit RPAC2 n=1 Tax=Prorops nasuta TaxID=863751 RepID=UPI0034CF82C6
MGRIDELAGDQTSGEKNRTFVFENEDHTLGNALRSIVSQYNDVDFCGYTVPHPAESKMHFRIQAKNSSAVNILIRGLKDLEKICDHTLEKFNAAYEEHKQSV